MMLERGGARMRGCNHSAGSWSTVEMLGEEGRSEGAQLGRAPELLVCVGAS